MYSFKDDYSEGAHPKILEKLLQTNLEQLEGYGNDTYSNEAKSLLKNIMKNEEIDIHFLSGGTQTNLIALSSFLRPHEAVIAPNTGHIFTNETGAIEATGHKVIAANVNDGKLRPNDVQLVLNKHKNEHVVKPRLVFISNPTEIGTIYSKSELQDLKDFCKEKNLILYMDGARLGSALTSIDNDVEISDLTKLLDAFYIGGTKCGALLGEALILVKENLKEDFRYFIKQKGGLLAKGRLLGIQFLTLFEENLYFDVSDYANKMAQILKRGIIDAGYSFLVESNSNQLFPILPNQLIQKLQSKYSFHVMESKGDDKSVIRLVTSWATNENYVKQFVKDLTL